MTAEEDVWCVTELLIAARHFPVAPDKVVRALPRVDRRSFGAGCMGGRSIETEIRGKRSGCPARERSRVSKTRHWVPGGPISELAGFEGYFRIAGDTGFTTN